jgi:hypothetical protein
LTGATVTRSALLLAIVGLSGSASHAAAQTSYCSPSGDFCTGIVRPGDDAILRIGTFAHRGRYRLCVTASGGSPTCKRFRLRRSSGDYYISRVRWRRHYPHEGPGVYRVRWQQFGGNLGPVLRFRVGPTMNVRPNTVRAGGRVRVFGSAGGCAPGNQMILLSEASLAATSSPACRPSSHRGAPTGATASGYGSRATAGPGSMRSAPAAAGGTWGSSGRWRCWRRNLDAACEISPGGSSRTPPRTSC